MFRCKTSGALRTKAKARSGPLKQKKKTFETTEKNVFTFMKWSSEICESEPVFGHSAGEISAEDHVAGLQALPHSSHPKKQRQKKKEPGRLPELFQRIN